MNKKSKYIKVSAVTLVVLIAILFIGKDKAISSNRFSDKIDIATNKVWTIKFDAEIDPNCITTDTISIVDSNGNKVAANISIGSDNKSILIDPPIDCYVPGKDYFIEINQSLRSVQGINLTESISMKFNTTEKFLDSTSFSDLPVVNSFKIAQQPAIVNERLDFNVTSNTSEAVQYRAYIYKYPNNVYDPTYKYSNIPYVEITNGYSNAIQGNTPQTFTKQEGLSEGKYKLMVFVRKAGAEGSHKNEYTDYDNFYSTYFRVLNKDIITNHSENETIKLINYDKTLEQVVNEEYLRGRALHDHGLKWIKASENIIGYYMNPANFLNEYGKYMFLDLRYMEGVSAQDLDNLLVGKGVLEGQGQVFLDAALANNINPIYLVSHSLLECGYGESQLASGISVSEVNGQPVEEKIVYNVFGVHAYDSNPNKYASEYAYEQGWFSVAEAIAGGAQYIGSSYINNSMYNQNTLYKMRYNVDKNWHQYATDIAWAYKQIKNISSLIESCGNPQPIYEIPVYK
ncbi:hypothetical protein SH2C18_11680 [Clostridium sediminicola]|uniref:glucosaminidase domain-containing protein n=1 Tax=Clostridium sediminicola TaxID=3114879 RepID=UPI0031F259EE